MPKRFEDPIEVPIAVLDGLESIQESGEANLQDPSKVQALAARMGYPETVAWIQEHRDEYFEGIFRGLIGAQQSRESSS